MDMTSVLPYAAFGAITFAIWAVYSFVTGKQSRATERLDEMRDPSLRNRDATAAGNMGRMFEKAAPTLSQCCSPSPNWKPAS